MARTRSPRRAWLALGALALVVGVAVVAVWYGPLERGSAATLESERVDGGLAGGGRGSQASEPPGRAVARPAEAEPWRVEPAAADAALDRRAFERLAQELFAGEPQLERLLAAARGLLERAAEREALPPATLPLVVPLGEGARLRVLPGRSDQEAEFQLELALELVPDAAFARGGVREGVVGSELELRFELGPEGARSFLASAGLRHEPGFDAREANADAGPLRLSALVTTDGGEALWLERALDARRREDGVVVGVAELGEPRPLGPLALDEPALARLLRRFLPAR